MTNYYANSEATRKVATSNVYHEHDRLRSGSISHKQQQQQQQQHKPESMSNTMRAMQQHPRASTKLRSVTIDIEPMLHQQQQQRRHLYEPNLAYAAGMDEILQRDQRTCHTNKSAAEIVPRAGSDAQKQQQQQPRWQQQYNSNNNNNYKSDSLHGAVISSMYKNNVNKCSSSSSSSSCGAVLDKEESDRVAVAARSNKSHIISRSCSNSHNNRSGSNNVSDSPNASQRLLDSSSSSSSGNEIVAAAADQQPMIASQQQHQQNHNSQCKMQRGLVLNARTYNDEMLKQQRKSQYSPSEKKGSDDHVSYTSVDLSDSRTTSTSSSSTESTGGSTTGSQEGLSRLRKAKCAFSCRTWLIFAVCQSARISAAVRDRIGYVHCRAGPYFTFGLGSLLVALFAVTVGQGAPLAMMSQEAREARRLVSVAKWKNPCGFAAEELADDDVEVVQLDDATLLGNIVMQAKTALNYAQNVRDDYVNKRDDAAIARESRKRRKREGIERTSERSGARESPPILFIYGVYIKKNNNFFFTLYTWVLSCVSSVVGSRHRYIYRVERVQLVRRIIYKHNIYITAESGPPDLHTKKPRRMRASLGQALYTLKVTQKVPSTPDQAHIRHGLQGSAPDLEGQPLRLAAGPRADTQAAGRAPRSRLSRQAGRAHARQCAAQRVRVPAALRGRPGAGRLGPAGQRARLPAGVQGHGESSAIGLVRGTDGPGRAQRAPARGHRSRHHARGVSQHVDQRDLSQSARLAHLSRLHERPRVHRRGVRSSDLADPEDVRLSWPSSDILRVIVESQYIYYVYIKSPRAHRAVFYILSIFIRHEEADSSVCLGVLMPVKRYIYRAANDLTPILCTASATDAMTSFLNGFLRLLAIRLTILLDHCNSLHTIRRTQTRMIVPLSIYDRLEATREKFSSLTLTLLLLLLCSLPCEDAALLSRKLILYNRENHASTVAIPQQQQQRNRYCDQYRVSTDRASCCYPRCRRETMNAHTTLTDLVTQKKLLLKLKKKNYKNNSKRYERLAVIVTFHLAHPVAAAAREDDFEVRACFNAPASKGGRRGAVSRAVYCVYARINQATTPSDIIYHVERAQRDRVCRHRCRTELRAATRYTPIWGADTYVCECVGSTPTPKALATARSRVEQRREGTREKKGAK
ncbi:unnamed protein product [Trichogramma brassicae]|uniref:Uncharacterized protein n=1 Tax=Trichogramma brassicae TaxID=86971 RepID=A0A6H5IPU9_9HYME|nr:unnamed protein product [Trichogramma brassicae]